MCVSLYVCLSLYVQPVVDSVAQNLEFISKNFQFSTRRTRIFICFSFFPCSWVVLIENFMGRILVRWKNFRNNLKIMCHTICNWLYLDICDVMIIQYRYLKRDLHPLKRALYFLERALYSLQRALCLSLCVSEYMWRVWYYNIVLSKEPYNSSKESYIPSKKPYIPSKEPHISLSMCLDICDVCDDIILFFQKSPIFPRKSPIFSQKILICSGMSYILYDYTSYPIKCTMYMYDYTIYPIKCAQHHTIYIYCHCIQCLLRSVIHHTIYITIQYIYIVIVSNVFKRHCIRS